MSDQSAPDDVVFTESDRKIRDRVDFADTCCGRCYGPCYVDLVLGS